MIKKTLLTALCLIALTFSTPTSVYAAGLTPIAISEQGDVAPAAEQTQWVFRVNEDGVIQKRLWSITYGVWLTDWIDAT